MKRGAVQISDDELEEFFDLLDEAIAISGSQNCLARNLEMKQTHISAYFCGTRRPGALVYKRLRAYVIEQRQIKAEMAAYRKGKPA